MSVMKHIPRKKEKRKTKYFTKTLTLQMHKLLHKYDISFLIRICYNLRETMKYTEMADTFFKRRRQIETIDFSL